jgi:flagellar biosynthesis/type III secretory pathway protein FliH
MNSGLDTSEHRLSPETNAVLGPPDQAEITEGNLLKENAEINRRELEQQKRTSFEDGFERGTDLAEQQFDTTQQQFLELIESISLAQSDMRTFYEPIKKLAVHLAEQLVRGELTLSTTAI